MFGFGILQTLGVAIAACVISYTAGCTIGGGNERAKHYAEKLAIEKNLKAQEQSHLEKLAEINEQYMEALDHAQIIPAKPCLDVDGVRVLNSIR